MANVSYTHLGDETNCVKRISSHFVSYIVSLLEIWNLDLYMYNLNILSLLCVKLLIRLNK